MHYNNWGDSRPISVNLQRDTTNISFPYFFDDKDNPVNLGSYGGIYEAYNYCPPLASIIGMASDAFVNAGFWALNKNTENDVRGVKKEWQSLLDNPNAWQDSAQFFKQLYTLRKLYGFCYVYKKKAVGFDKPSSMVVIPNWMLRIEPNFTADVRDNPENSRKIWLCFRGGKEILLDPKDLILFTDNTAFIDERTYLPQSRYVPQTKNINTIIAMLDAQELLIRKKGALGILSNKNTGQDNYALTQVTPKEKELIQREYNKYGLNSEQLRIIITEFPLEWQSMSMNVAELGLTEAQLNAIKGLCDATNFPFILSAYSDQSTYNNVTAADKRLYQNLIIPEANSILRILAKGVNAIQDNVIFEANYDHVPALQESKREQGLGLKAMNEANEKAWKNNVITRDEWLESIGRNKVPEGKGGDLYYYEFIALYGQQEESRQRETGSQQESQGAGNQNQSNNN